MNAGSFLSVCVILCLFLSSRPQRISTCNNSQIDVVENKINIIKCEGFDETDTIIWAIGNDDHVQKPLVICEFDKSCVEQPDGATADRNTEYSTLYLDVKRSQQGKSLFCKTKPQSGGESQSPSCQLNVKASSTEQPNTRTTKGPTTSTAIKSPQDKDPTDAPVQVEAIVGGAVAAFVVAIVIVVIVVVIICRRKRNRERSGKTNSHDQHVHYNPENGTGVALETSQNDDDDNAYAGPPEVGIYAFPGGDEPATIPDNTPAGEEDDVGMYAAPKADVYAAVDKSKPKKNKPAKSDQPDASQAAAVGDEYAVVNKASKKTDASNSTGLSEVHIPEDNGASATPAPYIYAQVDKTARNAKTAVSVSRSPEEEGATYAQVQKPKKK